MSDLQFEQHLRAHRPATPSSELAARIAKGLRGGAEPVCLQEQPSEPLLAGVLSRCGWALAGAAACALFAAVNSQELGRDRTTLVGGMDPAAATETTHYEPAEAVRTLIAAEDDGLVFDADSSPLRQVRYNYLERHAWTNRATGSRLEVELPREDTYLISVSIQ